MLAQTTPNKHPSNEFLIDYASGALSPALCLSVSTHLHFCETCRDRNTELNAVGGDLLDASVATELSANALDIVFGRLDAMESQSLTVQNVGQAAGGETVTIRELPEDEASLPNFITDLLPKTGANWKALTPSLRVSRIPIGEQQYELALHKIRAGGKVPEHDHKGLEVTVVLQGSFSDGEGIYQEGDYLIREPGQQHRPTASQNDQCICLSVSEAPIRLTGAIKRLMNPLFSVTPQ